MGTDFSMVDISAGAGAHSLGLDCVGFHPLALIEDDKDSRRTISLNRPWPTYQSVQEYYSVGATISPALLTGNLSSEGITLAGGRSHETETVFRRALDAVEKLQPRSVLLVNVASYLTSRHRPERLAISEQLEASGYQSYWRVIDSLHHGLPQSRRRAVLVAFRAGSFGEFVWPAPVAAGLSVGEALAPLMGARGWAGAAKWAELARGSAPTIVGGSKRHGGADLGPTRAKQIWYSLGVDGRGIADEPPPADALAGYHPRLTNQMVAVLQGFPPDWIFSGRKTSVYRQIARAFPAPTARALGNSVRAALESL